METGAHKAASADGIDDSIKTVFTEQGLAEEYTFMARLRRLGLVDDQMASYDCAKSLAVIRRWLDDSYSLTRVYIAAGLLESVEAACVPAQRGPWSHEDVERLTLATMRAAAALPARWKHLRAFYGDRHRVRDWFEAINAGGALAVGNRSCTGKALRLVPEDPYVGIQAFAKCHGDDGRLVLEGGAQAEQAARFVSTPAAVLMWTPFLGLDALVRSPERIAASLSTPSGRHELMVHVVNPVRLPSEAVALARIGGGEAAAIDQNLPDVDSDEAAGLQERQKALAETAKAESAAFALAVRPMRGDWPTPAECAQTRGAIGETIASAQTLGLLQVGLAFVMEMNLACPTPTAYPLYGINAGVLGQSLRRVAQALPERMSKTRARLMRPDEASRIFSETVNQMPKSVYSCWQKQVSLAHEEGMDFSTGQMMARAECLPVYPESATPVAAATAAATAGLWF